MVGAHSNPDPAADVLPPSDQLEWFVEVIAIDERDSCAVYLSVTMHNMRGDTLQLEHATLKIPVYVQS